MTESKKKVRLEIIVEFDDLSDLEEIKSQVENLTGYGKVVKADLVVPSETRMDLR